MQVTELQRTNHTDLYVTASSPVALELAGQEVQLRSRAFGGDAVIQIPDGDIAVRGVDEEVQQALHGLLARGLPHIALVQAIDGVTVHVRVHEFRSHQVCEHLDFELTSELLKSMGKRKPRPKTMGELAALLRDEFVVPGGPFGHRLIMTSNGQVGGKYRQRLLGRNGYASFVRNVENRLEIESVTPYPVRWQNTQPLLLVEANVNFVEKDAARPVPTLDAAQLEAATRVNAEYMSLWRRYNQLEEEHALHEARQFGIFRYNEAQQLDDGRYRFVLYFKHPEEKDRARRLRPGLQLEVARTVPYLLLDEQVRNSTTVTEAGKGPRVFAGEVKTVGARLDTLELYPLEHLQDAAPPPKGFLYLSISGDAVRLRRREEAFDRLTSGRAAMPNLLGILEGSFSVDHELDGQKLALSSAARAAFRGTPTEQQRRAVEIALNTPDIALIQGPPGTGKTRVVAAIQARLAELAEGREDIAGITLVTSYQHDAVENAANAIQVYNLPAVKIGRGSNRLTDDSSSNVERWRLTQMEHAEAVLGDLLGGDDTQAERALRQARELYDVYLNREVNQSSPSAFIRELLMAVQRWLSPSVRQDVARLLAQLETAPAELDDDLRREALAAVQRLRTTAEGFEDDGPRVARRALLLLKEAQVYDAERDHLLEAATRAERREPFDVAGLATLKAKLLDVLAFDERPSGSPVAAEDADAIARHAANTIIRDLHARAEVAYPTEASALARYAEDLRLHPLDVEDTVRKYSTVLAATCQQAVGYEMFNQKGKDEDFSFETVIVDEAARASPLDLIIPLARARRRIVLVGDHRQLPHMLEDAVRRQLDDPTAEGELSQSLFERLFVQLKAQEGKDGVKRVITLDVQYRMHPVLGSFVSRTFYEVHKEKFTSGLDEAHYPHDAAAFMGKVAAWVNTPMSEGREQRRRYSYARPAEAEVIADHVQTLLDSRTTMSIGIIAFYSAQVLEIWRALVRRGIAEEVGPDRFEILEAYRHLRAADNQYLEGLRVGTVDAFQGKEFDVVFLSTVRSNAVVPKNDRERNAKYGHLRLPNRLCVAMSRQKRLLVVVGDMDMIGPDVPQVQAFLELCQGDYGAIHA